MSSEETEDSLRLVVSDNYVISSSVADKVITKCLNSEPQCDERRNGIPCCSNDVTLSVVNEINTGSYPDKSGSESDKNTSDFIVIDLTCNVNDPSRRKAVGTKTNDCDRSSICSVDSCQSLVPVLNNEIVNTENQKLVSLSLSILLAALLQAMRCFAQFLENIVIPQR
ncbi:uncharacterized protein LOC132902004 [Amyelois transitella]|uniref:uncharacterized protein LOC132902004 n=1 Tax=Amyelois transitella TaxID=680683 RepID=UPI0029907514|nr:uncharacterized protein LOC132902004 [Amyelois transitella]